MHAGHIHLLRRAKAMGDYLIAGISTDEFNAIKHKQAYHSFEDRKTILASVRYIDKVISETSWEQKWDDIQKYQIDILVMGDDWRGEFDYLKSICEVIYLPRTKGVSTSKIKDDLS